jgi:hypothetical protein
MTVGKRVWLQPTENVDLPRFVEWFSGPPVRRHLNLVLPFLLVQ